MGIIKNISEYKLGYCPDAPVPEAKQWYFYSSRLLGAFTVFIGIYCSRLITKKIKEDSGSFKYYICAYHISSIMSGITSSLLSTPVYYFPLVSGYGIGLLSYLNISFLNQYYLNITTHFFVLAICVILFYYRYWLIRQRSYQYKSCILRFGIIFISIFYVAPYLITIGYFEPSSSLTSLVKSCPAYTTLLKVPCSVNIGRIHNEISLQIEAFLFVLNSVTFVISMLILKHLIIRNLDELKESMSKKTAMLHRKLLRTLQIQTLVPSSFIAFPCLAMFSAMVLDKPIPLDLSHILITIEQMHGIATTIGIIVLNNNILAQLTHDFTKWFSIGEKTTHPIHFTSVKSKSKSNT